MEAEESCVVVISNLPDAGLSQDEIFNLTKPFGGLKDFLVLSSHKKAYLEISQKSADSFVKFYSCFPVSVETNKLCIGMATEFKDLKDEEAVFMAMIKDSNPKANVEALHAQFVHLGNLPDVGYSELEILCVGLRFGRVDHYVVMSNKKKAILQLDSAESATSMCRFLKRYPYCLGDSQLTFSRSPKIEPSQAEATKKEVKKEEPSKERASSLSILGHLLLSPDLKKNPEGAGLVSAASVASTKPTEAKEEPPSQWKAAVAEAETEHSEKTESEAPSEPSKTVMSEGKVAPATDKPVDLSLSEVKSEEPLSLASHVENEKAAEKSTAALLGNASASPSGIKDEELPGPSDELAEALKGTAKTGERRPGPAKTEEAGPAKTEEGAEIAPAICESLALDLTEAPVAELPKGGLQSSTTPVSPGTDQTDASKKLPEVSVPEVGVKIETEPENPSSTVEGHMEVEPEPAEPQTTEVAKEEPELRADKSEAASEKQPEVVTSNSDSTQVEKLEKKAEDVSPERSLPKSQPSKELGQAPPDESSKASVPATDSSPSAEANYASKTILKALMSVPNVSKKRTATRKKEEQKPTPKTGTRGGTVAEKKPVPKEASQQRPTSSKSNLAASKSKPRLSSFVVKVGSGKSSSQQDKDSQVETKGSSKQTQEQETRSSTGKRDGSKEKAPAGRNTRSSNICTSPKEEDELFPFNLDEFVTVDEVTDEVDSPPQPRRNPPRSRRKDASCEPSSKRRKGKTSVAHEDAERELSFVTLDEIREDEGGMTQAAEHLEAIPDPQGLVTVDELNDEEEFISEVARDPQSLVTLDEISEQEDPASTKEAGSEPDLKAEPLVTVDEIGEVEELSLDEPLPFKTESFSERREEKRVLEDPGDLLSSQMPEDPSTLVTVDEIHEDGDDQPLVTLDEVTEEDDDFLPDFSHLDGELNFVTVDEVGSEDEEEEKEEDGEEEEREEEKVAVKSTDKEELVATTVPEEEAASTVVAPVEDLLPAAKHEETVILDDASPGEKACPGQDLPEENKAAEVEASEKENDAAEMDKQETTLVEGEKDEEGEDLEQTIKEETEAEAHWDHPLAESTSNLSGNKGSDAEDIQQPSESESREEDMEGKTVGMDVEQCSESVLHEEQTGDMVTPPPALEVSAEDSQTSLGEDPKARSEQEGQDPDSKEENCGKTTPSQSSKKHEKELAGSECKAQEPEQKEVDSSEKSKTPHDTEDLDFLVPKAGFFCQICSCFCVDEASMKTHCQSALHQQNKKKFMSKKAEEEKKDSEGDAAR
uniref:Uncharacterized protein n=1 Tax=Sphaerodactylus townsendi TaxID=933632 RepID=A0ACB8E8Y1_9SAUR